MAWLGCDHISVNESILALQGDNIDCFLDGAEDI